MQEPDQMRDDPDQMQEEAEQMAKESQTQQAVHPEEEGEAGQVQ
jgi:hypothetical protein